MVMVPWLCGRDAASILGVMGGCNHQHLRDRVFSVQETVVACKPPCLLGHHVLREVLEGGEGGGEGV